MRGAVKPVLETTENPTESDYSFFPYYSSLPVHALTVMRCSIMKNMVPADQGIQTTAQDRPPGADQRVFDCIMAVPGSNQGRAYQVRHDRSVTMNPGVVKKHGLHLLLRKKYFPAVDNQFAIDGFSVMNQVAAVLQEKAGLHAGE